MSATITARVARPPRWRHPFPTTHLRCLLRRTTTTTVADRSRPPSRTSPPFPPESLTILHKTSVLLPRVLPTDASRFWSKVLADAYDDLTSSAAVARVVVYGVGHWQSSGAQDLVSALLVTPFASDADNDFIRSRWRGHDDEVGLTIHWQQQGDEQPLEAQDLGLLALRVQSSYFVSSSLPIQITELRTPTTPAFHAPDGIDTKRLAVLLKADVPVIVCNPLTTPLTTLSQLLGAFVHPNTIVVFTTAPVPHLIEPIKSLLCKQRPGRGTQEDMGPDILFIDPQRALSALDTLEHDPTSSSAIQCFQHDLLGSGISSLTEAIQRVLTTAVTLATAATGTGDHSSPSTTAASTTILRTQTAHAQTWGALLACWAAVKQAESEVENVRAGTSQLRGRVEEARATASRNVFMQHDPSVPSRSFSSSSSSGDDVDVVRKALADAEREMGVMMRRLTWWRMVWRVDEIETVVDDAVRRVWCRDLEQHLIFHAGRLAALQDDLSTSTYTLLDSIPSSSALASPVLRNNLAQLGTSTTHDASSPLALIAPLHARRTQLAQHPTAYLHRAAQRAVLGMFGGAATGAGLCWAGVSSAVMIGGAEVGTGTAVAAAVFGSLAGVRWGIGLWERAVRRWWMDWERVGEGLGRDLKAALEVSVDEAVKIAERGCAGLEELAKKRKGEVEEVKEEVEKLEDALKERSWSRRFVDKQ